MSTTAIRPPVRKKTHVKKGDQVTVIAGNFKGESGRVLQVLVKKDRVIVEGVRKIKKHVPKSQDRPQGGIIEREGPIHISNVKLVEGAAAAADPKPAKKAKATKAPAGAAKETKEPKADKAAKETEKERAKAKTPKAEKK